MGWDGMGWDGMGWGVGEGASEGVREGGGRSLSYCIAGGEVVGAHEAWQEMGDAHGSRGLAGQTREVKQTKSRPKQNQTLNDCCSLLAVCCRTLRQQDAKDDHNKQGRRISKIKQPKTLHKQPVLPPPTPTTDATDTSTANTTRLKRTHPVSRTSK